MGWKKARDITNAPAVFKLPLAKENLQWAGGSVIRLYTEYLWENQMYDKISFQFSRLLQHSIKKWKVPHPQRCDRCNLGQWW